MRRIAFAFLVFMIAALGLAQKVTKIKVGDMIAVQVFGGEAYSGDFSVLSDGSITGPGFGRIVVEGKSVASVENSVRTRLLKYLKRPIVTVYLKTERQEFVFVSGAHTVNPAGLQYLPGLDLRQIIGSVDLPADPDLLEADVFRHNEPPVRVPLYDLLHPTGKDVNIKLQPNDMIAVQPVAFVRVWVTGLVHTPGQLRVPAGADAYKALAQAGGIAFDQVKAEDALIFVRRGPDMIPVPSRQDQNSPAVTLESGDTLIVEKPSQIRITVGGEVRSPGEIQLREKSSIVTAISKAGGLVPEGGLRDVLILRRGEAFQVDAVSVRSGHAEPQFMLEDGDTIFVRPNQRFFVVVGQVLKSGRFMMDEDKTYHLADTLAAANGLLPTGTLRRVYLGRKGPGGRFVTTSYNLDEFLKDGKSAANPLIQSGDVVLFTEPKGITFSSATQALSAALILASLKKL